MRKNFWIFYSFLCCLVVVLIVMPIIDIYSIEENFLVSFEDMETANSNGTFGAYISGELEQKEQSTGLEQTKTGEVVTREMLLKKVWLELGKITGNTENEDIISLIFSKFCLGK